VDGGSLQEIFEALSSGSSRRKSAAPEAVDVNQVDMVSRFDGQL